MSHPEVRRSSPVPSGPQPTGLADLLERVLDKGLVIAGDIRVNLLDIELLTIKLRLVIASMDTAREAGIDWWTRDPWLKASESELMRENHKLRERLAAAGQREPGAVESRERGHD